MCSFDMTNVVTFIFMKFDKVELDFAYCFQKNSYVFF